MSIFFIEEDYPKYDMAEYGGGRGGGWKKSFRRVGGRGRGWKKASYQKRRETNQIHM